jgi:hypothetical protein
MEDYYIKEIFDNYYNKVLSFQLPLPKLIVKKKTTLKNKKITILKVNTDMQIFNFKLIEMKNKAIVIEECGITRKIYKFEDKKISNLSNSGILIVDLRNKKIIERCVFKEGQLHNWDGFAVLKKNQNQYWINGERHKDLDSVNKLKLKLNIEAF